MPTITLHFAAGVLNRPSATTLTGYIFTVRKLQRISQLI